MKTKILWILIGIVLMVTSLCSASSMWKASPFYAERDNASRAEAVNRINLWPMFYHYKPYTSALWPIFDKRDDGYALRPLFSVYRKGDELNVLWPLSSFDFEEKEYHILNNFWSTNFLVSFPFYFYEKDSFWLASFIAGKGSNWYSVMPPMWVHTYKSTNYYSYFCMPLLTYFEREDSDYSFTTFPIFHQSRQEKTFKQELLLFLYEYEKSPKMKNVKFFPLYSYKKNDRRTSHLLFPLFYTKKEFQRDTLITPLFGTLMGSNVFRVITPLVSVSHSEKDHFVNVLGPLYNFAWNDDNKFKRTDVVWPLFTHERSGKTRTVSSFPLASFKKTETKKSGYILWPLYNYEFETNKSFYNFIFPLAGKGHKIRERRIWEGRTDSKETTTQNWTWIVPFTYWNKSTCYEKDYSIPVPNEIKRGNGNRIDWKKAKAQTNIWNSFAKKHYKPYIRTRCGSFPFFSYLSKENINSEFRILFWLYDSKWTAAEKDSFENTHRRVLWRLMDYEKSGANVSMDIFPFITYDKIPEKEISQVSVFWRLFRWREEKEKKALDILFIPFRWGN